jgi:hypothetical protein
MKDLFKIIKNPAPRTFAFVDKKSIETGGAMAPVQDRTFRHHEASMISWGPAGRPSVPSITEFHLPRPSLRNPGDSVSGNCLPADAAFKIQSCTEANTRGDFKNEPVANKKMSGKKTAGSEPG